MTLFLAFCYVTSVDAAEFAYRYHAGINLTKLHYKEFDDEGALLDREDGLLPGIQLGLNLHALPLTITLSAAAYDGTIDYRGHTQSGTTLNTNTRETIANYSIGLIREISANAYPSALIAEIGMRQWKRNIQSTATTDSLYEVYRWPHYLAGGTTTLWRNSNLELGVRGLVGRSFDATLEVHIKGFDTTTLDLRNGETIHLSMPIAYRWHSRHALLIEPHIQYWHFEKSTARPLLQAGQKTGFQIHEPENESFVFGIALSTHF